MMQGVVATLSSSIQPSSRARFAKTYNHYRQFCLEHAFQIPPAKGWTLPSLCAYLKAKCELMGNSTSAVQWASHIKSHCDITLQADPPTAHEAKVLARMCKGLNELIPEVEDQAPGVPPELLIHMNDVLQPHPSKDIRTWAFLLEIRTRWKLMLRPNEFAVDAEKPVHARAKDMVFYEATAFHPAGLTFRIEGPKGVKLRRGGRKAQFTYARSQPGHPLDIVADWKYYYAYFKLNEYPLFPIGGIITSEGLLTRTQRTQQQFNEAFRALLTRCDVQQDFTARSLRIGHRTYLEGLGVPDHTIRLLGRWKHVETSELYNRPTEHFINSVPLLPPA
jgi:hypothetical protein